MGPLAQIMGEHKEARLPRILVAATPVVYCSEMELNVCKCSTG